MAPAGPPRRTLLSMSSDRPGRPADVVPGDGGGGDPPGDDSAASPSGAAPSRGARGEKKRGSLLKELPILLVIAFVLALLVKTFLVQAFFIPSGSMEQTLHGCTGCTGDRVLVNKVPYWFGEPKPGDIVVFKGPETWAPEVTVAPASNWFTGSLLWLGRAVGVAPPSDEDFVKRVIATGGQTVQCCDTQGRVTVDGKPLDEPYIYQNTPIDQRPFGPVTVPQGRLWVMGDHRSNSADSRVHLTDKFSGTVAVDDVIGKAALIVWPLNRFSILHAPDIQGNDAAALPPAVGLAAAVPVVVWRRSRRGGPEGPPRED
jgi:signal peptidase I